MLKANLSKSVPRVELDRRARNARLRLERIERLLAPRAGMDLCLFSFGTYGEASQGNRGGGRLINRQPSRMGQCV